MSQLTPQQIINNMVAKNPQFKSVLNAASMMNPNAPPDTYIDFLTRQFPQLSNHPMINACRGKSQQEINEYAQRLLKSTGMQG